MSEEINHYKAPIMTLSPKVILQGELKVLEYSLRRTKKKESREHIERQMIILMKKIEAL